MTHKVARHHSFPLSFTIDPAAPGSWMHSATVPDEDNNPSPGEYCHLAGKTSGGSVPLAVPPALLAEDFTQAIEHFHPYVRTVILTNIAYDISWGLFSTWLVETLRINRLHLVHMNSNPDL